MKSLCLVGRGLDVDECIFQKVCVFVCVCVCVCVGGGVGLFPLTIDSIQEVTFLEKLRRLSLKELDMNDFTRLFEDIEGVAGCE